MCEHDVQQKSYILRHQRHGHLVFFIKQLFFRQVALQGLVVNHPIPHQRFAITTDQTRSQRFQVFVWDDLHHLQTSEISGTHWMCCSLDSLILQVCSSSHQYALIHLFGNSGEFHNVESLVVGGSTLVNVDDH